jgi:CBS domain-containing protein
MVLLLDVVIVIAEPSRCEVTAFCPATPPARRAGAADATLSAMRAGELCIRDVVTALEDESTLDAARRMAQLDVGDLIVVRERRYGQPHPIGIVTDRDLVVRVLACELAPATTKVSDIMRRELVTASEDDDIETVAAKMRTHAIRRMPVVDHLGNLQGVLSIDDVIGWMRDQLQTASKLLEQQGGGPRLNARAAP